MVKQFCDSLRGSDLMTKVDDQSKTADPNATFKHPEMASTRDL
jgi:hypothetical protein